nr:putative ribonuclease H-like domain-containing protein [Tanacetum cinerariifolium]
MLADSKLPTTFWAEAVNTACNQSNVSAGKARVETVPNKDYILLPLWTQDPLLSSSSKDSLGDRLKPSGEEEKKDAKNTRNGDNEVLSTEEPRVNQEKDANVNNTNNINIVSPTANVANIKDNVVDENIVYGCVDDPNMPNLEEIFYSNVVKINKKDERGIMVRNKARLVAQGYTQEEGIDYDDIFAPVARIKAIRLFLAYSLFTEFIVYKMEVKSEFLYGKIEEEVYVCQPLGFKDPEFPDRVYKEMCTEFDKMMHKKFHISSMGELTFFLGLQVTQQDNGIFISQDKYMHEILKKFGFSTVKTAS